VGDTTKGIAVLKRGEGRLELSHVVLLESPPQAMALTHDGKLLIAPAFNQIIFLDVQRLMTGADPVLGAFPDEGGGAGNANVTPDDRLLFVSEEATRSITVIDLERARANRYQADAILGRIPTGNGPSAITFSLDGNWLYSTSQIALPDWNWPKACKAQGTSGSTELINPQGAVIIADVARARTDPAHSVVARISAGCHPGRMAISPQGDRIYVTARNSNAVLAFDAAKLLSDPENARIGMAPVGQAPIPIVVIDGGRKVVAGNSNRFVSPGSPQTLTVLDTAKMPEGADAVLGTIEAGAFPRGLSVSQDGLTLFLTNAGSNSLQMIDLGRLPLTPGAER
jgi:DNA-binding beta-propeller fold protein YncE